jgi:hypothetical protein
MTGDGRKTFASLFDANAREVTKPDHPAATSKDARRERSSALLVDPACSATSNKRIITVDRPKSVDVQAVEVHDLIDETPVNNALSSTMEVSSREYQQILRAAAALRFEEVSFDGNDPFSKVEDSPDFADKSLRPTIKCPSWEDRDEATLRNLEVQHTESVHDKTTQLNSATGLSPRPITLAGDLPSAAPAEVTLDSDADSSFEDDQDPFQDDAVETRLDTFPLESKPPPIPDDASFDDAIRQAVDPFGFGRAPAPSLDETGEWTAPDGILPQRLPTRVSAPTERDIERGRELYVAAIEELAMHRKTAALVHARLALGYDPDNHNYKNFCDDLVKMLGADVDVSASGTLPVLDADIVSWDGSSRG